MHSDDDGLSGSHVSVSGDSESEVGAAVIVPTSAGTSASYGVSRRSSFGKRDAKPLRIESL